MKRGGDSPGRDQAGRDLLQLCSRDRPQTWDLLSHTSLREPAGILIGIMEEQSRGIGSRLFPWGRFRGIHVDSKKRFMQSIIKGIQKALQFIDGVMQTCFDKVR